MSEPSITAIEGFAVLRQRRIGGVGPKSNNCYRCRRVPSRRLCSFALHHPAQGAGTTLRRHRARAPRETCNHHRIRHASL